MFWVLTIYFTMQNLLLPLYSFTVSDWLANSSSFVQGCPSVKPESLVSQELPQFKAIWDGWAFYGPSVPPHFFIYICFPFIFACKLRLCSDYKDNASPLQCLPTSYFLLRNSGDIPLLLQRSLLCSGYLLLLAEDLTRIGFCLAKHD